MPRVPRNRSSTSCANRSCIDPLRRSRLSSIDTPRPRRYRAEATGATDAPSGVDLVRPRILKIRFGSLVGDPALLAGGQPFGGRVQPRGVEPVVGAPAARHEV